MSRARRPIAWCSTSMSRRNRPANSRYRGGYSTDDGFIAEASIADRNLMGRGQFAKASVSYGQNSRGFELIFRRALSARLSHGGRHRPVCQAEPRDQLRLLRIEDGRRQSSLGFALTEELSFAPHYSIYRQEISLPDQCNNCQ